MNEHLHRTLSQQLRKILNENKSDINAQVILLAINDLQGEMTQQEKSLVVRAVSHLYEQNEGEKRTLIDILANINTPQAQSVLGSFCEQDVKLALYIKKTLDAMSRR